MTKKEFILSFYKFIGELNRRYQIGNLVDFWDESGTTLFQIHRPDSVITLIPGHCGNVLIVSEDTPGPGAFSTSDLEDVFFTAHDLGVTLISYLFENEETRARVMDEFVRPFFRNLGIDDE